MTVLNPSLWADAPDLRARLIENSALAVFDLFRAVAESEAAVIRGRTFRNCRLEGPAIALILSGNVFNDCNLGPAGGSISNLLVRPVGEKVVGAVPFEDCRFEACEFFAVGFTGSEQTLGGFLAIEADESAGA